jgi:uncharacterized protein YjbI with pentapeptide repeats/DNA-binding XRE family transcriptional regulator
VIGKTSSQAHPIIPCQREGDKVVDERELIRRYVSGQRNFSRAILGKGSLSGAFLTMACLREANLTEASLTEAKLRWADLTKADLSRANLSGADLTGANSSRANLSGADLTGASLEGANLREANLTEASLSRAKLRWADLRGANSSRANLSGADLTGADLSRVKLLGADLTGANLEGATLRWADLTRANLEGATLTDEQLAQANPLERATLPDGTKYIRETELEPTPTETVSGDTEERPPDGGLRVARKRAGLSRKEVAARAGVSVSSLGWWERQGEEPRSAEVRRKIAEVVGCWPWSGNPEGSNHA